jgi:hypothetical protein
VANRNQHAVDAYRLLKGIMRHDPRVAIIRR